MVESVLLDCAHQEPPDALAAVVGVHEEAGRDGEAFDAVVSVVVPGLGDFVVGGRLR